MYTGQDDRKSRSVSYVTRQVMFKISVNLGNAHKMYATSGEFHYARRAYFLFVIYQSLTAQYAHMRIFLAHICLKMLLFSNMRTWQLKGHEIGLTNRIELLKKYQL